MDLLNYKPGKPFSHKHLLTMQDYSADDILQILSLALRLKKLRAQGASFTPLAGQKLAMIFAKPSMRTRVSFQVGFVELGGYPFLLTNEEIGLGGRESVPDVARVLSRYADGIMIRTFAQSDVDGLAKYGSVPVINGLTDDFHPCQALADLLTVYENFGEFKGRKLAFIGDGNNVAASLMIICAKLGMDIAIGCPKGFEPPAAITAQTQSWAKETGAVLTITNDPAAAAAKADVVYTDVWASMGQEAQAAEKNAAFAGFQVNDKLMSAALPQSIFLHCLPAHRGEEVTDSVMESAQSKVFDEAENRLHAQKAVMALLMNKGGALF